MSSPQTLLQSKLATLKGDSSQDHPDHRKTLTFRIEAGLSKPVVEYEFNDVSVF